jgi:hypothetical protein
MWKKLVITRRKKKLAVLIVPIKVVELVVEVIAQLVKTIRVPFGYPCITYFSSKHRAPNYPKKQKFRTCFRLSQPLLPLL